MVAFNSNMVVFMVVVASMALCSSAMKHTVGGAFGWDIPADPTFYTKWASNRIFIVGDSLVFNFKADDVTEVSKDEYERCDINNPRDTKTTSPATFNLTKPGHHYYISSLEGHCDFDQTLVINVSSKGYSFVGV